MKYKDIIKINRTIESQSKKYENTHASIQSIFILDINNESVITYTVILHTYYIHEVRAHNSYQAITNIR